MGAVAFVICVTLLTLFNVVTWNAAPDCKGKN